MKNYTYKTFIEPDADGYHGFVPLLKGLHTFGKTVAETKKNLEEAIQCHVEGLLKDGINPPKQQDTIELTQTVSLNA